LFAASTSQAQRVPTAASAAVCTLKSELAFWSGSYNYFPAKFAVFGVLVNALVQTLKANAIFTSDLMRLNEDQKRTIDRGIHSLSSP